MPVYSKAADVRTMTPRSHITERSEGVFQGPVAGTGLMSVSPPATTRVYSGASPYCLGKASRAPIWFLTRSPGGYPAMSKMTLLRPSSTSASCTNERFRNDPTPNWFSRAWGLRNGIAGEIQLVLMYLTPRRQVHKHRSFLSR